MPKKTSAQRRAAEEGKEFFRKYKSENDDEIQASLSALEMADFNIGTSYAKSGDFEKALHHFTSFFAFHEKQGEYSYDGTLLVLHGRSLY